MGWLSAAAAVVSAVAALYAMYIARSSLRAQMTSAQEQLKLTRAQIESDRQRELSAQAVLVAAWSERLKELDPPKPGRKNRTIIAYNGSISPIWDVETWQYDQRTDDYHAVQPPSRAHFSMRSVVEPLSQFPRDREVAAPGPAHPPAVGVKFRDVRGELWWRDFSGELHNLSVVRADS